VGPEAVIARAVTPQGRTVEITAPVWSYVQKHHGMEGALDLVCLAISRPDVQAQDPRPGRERYSASRRSSAAARRRADER
jgi:hypothetical protein